MTPSGKISEEARRFVDRHGPPARRKPKAGGKAGREKNPIRQKPVAESKPKGRAEADREEAGSTPRSIRSGGSLEKGREESRRRKPQVQAAATPPPQPQKPKGADFRPEQDRGPCSNKRESDPVRPRPVKALNSNAALWFVQGQGRR